MNEFLQCYDTPNLSTAATSPCRVAGLFPLPKHKPVYCITAYIYAVLLSLPLWFLVRNGLWVMMEDGGKEQRKQCVCVCLCAGLTPSQ